MMRVLKESRDALSRHAPAQCIDQIIVREGTFNFAVCDGFVFGGKR